MEAIERERSSMYSLAAGVSGFATAVGTAPTGGELLTRSDERDVHRQAHAVAPLVFGAIQRRVGSGDERRRIDLRRHRHRDAEARRHPHNLAFPADRQFREFAAERIGDALRAFDWRLRQEHEKLFAAVAAL